MQECINYLGSFEAFDEKGRPYTVRMYRQYGDTDIERIPATRVLKLVDTTPVERIEKGKYRVVDVPGRDVFLTSDDPDAP
jgi:hypothetical protein